MADITTLIMVLVLLGAFCVPFIYAHHKKKQQEKQLVTSLMAKAKEHQLQIHAYEIWRRTYVIGLDKDLLQLMYIKFHPEMQTRIVDLKKINKVRVINEHRLVGADKQTVIDKLWLLLMHKDQLHPDIHLEFFNAQENDDLLGELTLIQRWQKLLEVTINDYQEKSLDMKNGTGRRSLQV